MMNAVLGIVVVALCFGLGTMFRARDRGGCTGGCAGCTGDGRCETTDDINAATHGAKS